MQISFLTHFPLIQVDLTPLIEEQINHRTVTDRAVHIKMEWMGKTVVHQVNQLPWALEGEQLPLQCSVTEQPAVILGFSTSPINYLFLP